MTAFAASQDRGWIGRRDPRVRLAGAFAFALALPLLARPLPLGLALAFAVIMVAAARPDIGTVLRRLIVVEGFLLVLLVTLPFAVPGQPAFSLWGLTASLEGIGRALTLLVRINAAVLMLLALVGGLSAQRLASAMTGLGLPVVLATLMLLTLRYVATIGEEYRRLRHAMLVRGFRAGNNRHSWRSLGNLVGMLLLRSLDRADNVYRAMLCRGYEGRFPAFATPARLRPADYGFAALVALALLALIALEWLA